jgi:hypothetical protein
MELRKIGQETLPTVLYGAKNMNMISTGAFLTEMDASDKQHSLVNKLVTAWEKKNSKTARAGGVSLMALSLAACGGSDDTPFSQADIDTAKSGVDLTTDNAAAVLTAVTAVDANAATVSAVKTNATAAALTDSAGTVHSSVDVAKTSDNGALLTHANGTTYASVDAAYTAGNNVTNASAVATALTDANGVTHNNVDVAIASDNAAVTTTATNAAEATLVSGSGFSTVAALLSAYQAAVAPDSAASVSLTTATETIISTFTGVSDTITAVFGTVNAGDILIDSFTTDSDVANLVVDTAIATTIGNIETINIDARDNANADQFVVDAINMSGYTRMSIDSNYSEVDFLLNDMLDGSTVAIDSTTTSFTFNMNRTGAAESNVTTGTIELAGGVTTNFDKGTTDDVDGLTINSIGSTANTIIMLETEDYLSTAASPDSTTITGTQSLVMTMSQEVNAQGFDGGAITNSLTGAATLTLRLTDDDAAGDTALEGAQIDLDSVNADVIQLDTITQDATDLKVASGQVISTRVADDLVGDILITSATAGGTLTLNLAAGEANTSTDTVEFVSSNNAIIGSTAATAITAAFTDITTSYTGIGNKTDLEIKTGAGLTLTGTIVKAETGSTLDDVTITGGGDFTNQTSGSFTLANAFKATVEDGSFESITATGGTTVNASKSATMLEVLTGTDNSGEVNVTAGTTVTMNENVGASGTEVSNVAITAGTAYSSVGGAADMDVNGTVAITSGTTLAIGDSDDIASTGKATLSAGTTVSVDGDVVAATGGISITAGTSVTSLDNGAITATSGNIDITAGTTNTFGSAVTATGDVTITAATSTDANATLTATGGNLTLVGSGTTDTTLQSITAATITLASDGHEYTVDNGNYDWVGDVNISNGAKLDATAATTISITGTVTHTGDGTVKIQDLVGNYSGASATGLVDIDDTAAGAASIVTGSGNDNIITGDVEAAITTNAGNDVVNAAGVTTTSNMVNISTGAGNDTINAGSAVDDIISGGTGTDTLNFTDDTLSAFTERFTDFEVGSAGDVLRFDSSAMDSIGGTMTSTTLKKVDTTDGAVTEAHATTDILVLTGTTYATVTTMVTALNGTSGLSGTVVVNKAILTIFADTDGHSYATMLEGDATDFSSTDAELIRLDGLGISDLAGITQDNFVFF